MNKKGILISIIAFLLGALIASGFFAFCFNRSGEAYEHGNNVITVGDIPLSEYGIVSKFGTYKEARKLSEYIYRSTGTKLKIRFKAGDHNIFLSHKTENDVFMIDEGEIYLLSKGDGLDKMVEAAANSLFGLAFAGEEREHLLYTDKEINLPVYRSFNAKVGWMPEREPIICLWDPSNTRGVYYNPNTAKDVDILSYSDDKLYEYVKMMQHLGFTGIQVTDICSSWAEFGSYEYVQQRLRFMADAAHSLGMDFTLWVWGSEFNGYGWVDRSVTYHGDTVLDIDLDSVKDTYDKYYSIYTELADCSDRLIVHYFEPGHVHTMANAAHFLKIIYDKFHGINPDIKVGINVYSNYFDIDVLKAELGDLASELTYYTLAAPNVRDYEHIRQVMSDNGLNYGIWSWGVCEREIDQTAQMNVNANEIKDTYLRTMAFDGIYKPDYWSEMDSYHILNYFSLFASGYLLRDLDLNADALLRESANSLVGEEQGDKLYTVLKLIERARTGYSLSTFEEGDLNTVFSQDFPAEEIYSGCVDSLAILDSLLSSDDLKTDVPIPVDTGRILELIKPHVLQIQEYAKFRIELAGLRERALAGESADALREGLSRIYTAIPEYDVVTGVWGLIEQRAMTKYVNDFCSEFGLEPVINETVDHYRKLRIFGEFESLQKTSVTRLDFAIDTGFQLGVAYGADETARLVREMVETGLLSYTPDGEHVFITDWEKYAFAD